MADSDVLAAAFEQHRAHLRSVAYRLLGSAADADDAVQDTWLRLTSAGADDVENLGGWLTTVVARVSLNMLRSRRRRREEPVGDSWPAGAEAAADGQTGTGGGSAAGEATARRADPAEEAVLADSVGLAMLVVLDTLSPAERIAFVLHDLFAMPFSDVAAVLGRSPDAARQLASRARRRVRGAPDPGQAADIARQREVASAFLAAARGGDLAALVAVLDDEVTFSADARAVPAGRPMVLSGAEAVSRGAIASAGRARHSELALVDGKVAILYAPAGRLQLVLAPTVGASGKITAIEVIASPERLSGLRLAMLPA